MAAVTLVYSTPVLNTAEVTILLRRRVVLPGTGPVWLRIYSTSETYYEPVDASDASARGAGYETIQAYTVTWRLVRRGEVAISAAVTVAVVELTAEQA